MLRGALEIEIDVPKVIAMSDRVHLRNAKEEEKQNQWRQCSWSPCTQR